MLKYDMIFVSGDMGIVAGGFGYAEQFRHSKGFGCAPPGMGHAGTAVIGCQEHFNGYHFLF